jgi:hypothetical protein
MRVIGSSSWFRPGFDDWLSKRAILVDGEDLDISAPDFALLLEEAVVALPVQELIDKLAAVLQLDVHALAFVGGGVRGSHNERYM